MESWFVLREEALLSPRPNAILGLWSIRLFSSLSSFRPNDGMKLKRLDDLLLCVGSACVVLLFRLKLKLVRLESEERLGSAGDEAEATALSLGIGLAMLTGGYFLDLRGFSSSSVRPPKSDPRLPKPSFSLSPLSVLDLRWPWGLVVCPGACAGLACGNPVEASS